jgi:hypothetical protein
MESSSKRVIAFVLCLRAFPDIALAQVRDGLLGHTWGTPIAAVVEPLQLTMPQFKNDTALYSSGVHEIDDTRIEQCNIEFVHGQLAGIIVTTRGEANSHRLLVLLQKCYGEGTERNPRSWTWRVGETHVSFDLDSLGDAYAYWYSMRLQE